MRLSSRLLLSVLPLVALLMSAFGLWLLDERERSLVPELQQQTQYYAHAVDIAFEYALHDLDKTRVQALIDRLSADPLIFGVLLYGPDGSVRYTSDSLTGAAAAPDSILSRVLAGGEEATFERTLNGRQVYAVLRSIREPTFDPARGPLASDTSTNHQHSGAVLGALEIAQPFGLLRGEQQRVRAEVLLVTIALLTALALTLVVVTHRTVRRPLNRLTEAARALGEGHTEARVLTSLGARELNDLAREFNDMASRLGAARDALLRESEERVGLERRLSEAEKLATVGVVAAGLAHEIGAPLNVISGRAEMLLQQHGDDAKISRHLESIIAQIGRITRTVRSLLDYARRPERQNERVPLATVLNGAIDLLEAEFAKASVRVTETFSTVGSALSVSGDADQLEQVIVNLMLNALQAMDAQGEPRSIHVNLRMEKVDRGTQAADAVIEIIDSGPGLAYEVAGRLFTPFLTTKPSGTGLGLVVARSMIQDHGGTLVGTNRQANERGAIFTVRLPLAPPMGAAAQPASAGAAPTPFTPAQSATQPLS